MSFVVFEKKHTTNNNAAHEKRQHNRSHSHFMIAEVGGMPILKVQHVPNPRTLSVFNEKSLVHNKKIQTALQNALRNSRKSKHNKEVERARFRSVLSSRIGGNAPNVMINRVYPLRHYPGFVPRNRRSNIRRPNNKPNNKSKFMPPRVNSKVSFDTVISPL